MWQKNKKRSTTVTKKKCKKIRGSTFFSSKYPFWGSFFVLLSVALLLSSCKSKSVLNTKDPLHDYSQNPELTVFTLPISIEIAQLEASINDELENNVFDDIESSGFDLEIQKAADVELAFGDRSLSSIVPLFIKVSKDLGITTARVSGKIQLTIEAKYDIHQDWSVSADTEITDHTWLQKPKLKIGIIGFNVQYLAEEVLKRFKPVISSMIDKELKKHLSFESYAKEAWKLLEKPLPLSEEYNMSLLFQPVEIGMTPLLSDEKTLRTAIVIKTRSEVVPDSLITQHNSAPPLPPLKVVAGQYATPKAHPVRFSVDMSYNSVEAFAREQILHKTFERGKYKVTVEDMDLRSDLDQIIVSLKMSGSYNGRIYVSGQPEFQEEKEVVTVKKLRLKLKTKNVLHKTLAWLFKKRIKKSIEEQLVFPFGDQLAEVRKQIATLSGHTFSDHLAVNSQLADLHISRILMTSKGIRVEFVSNGKLELVYVPDN